MLVGVDAAGAALGGRVPRLLGPARGLRLRRRHPDHRRPGGRARQGDAGGVGARVPRRLGGLPARGPGRGAGDQPGDARRRSPTCSTRSSRRRAVKDIQSGIKDPDRFDKWVELLQERVDYDDPIVLPYGEGMNIVRRASDGELVIRTDAGADLCRWDENWKMHVPMFVRDSDELYRGGLPRARPPRRRLAGAARVLLPALRPPAGDRSGAARLPGHARVPARHRGFLQRLAGARPPRLIARG